MRHAAGNTALPLEHLGQAMARTRNELLLNLRATMGDQSPFFSWLIFSRLLAALALFFVTGCV
jgi:hypothetical protein